MQTLSFFYFFKKGELYLNGYKFNLEPYCDNCPEFDVRVTTEELWTFDHAANVCCDEESAIYYAPKTISCSHARRCNNMVKYLESKKLKGDKNESGPINSKM